MSTKVNKENRCAVGTVHKMNSGETVIVVTYSGWKEITVKFLNVGGAVLKVQCSAIYSGSIKDPYSRSVQGVGFVGQGDYKVGTECGRVWRSMMARCYSKKYQATRLTYKDVVVCKSWENFQNFASWFYEDSNYTKGFHLDKDILVLNNKVYSPETCCFVPSRINNLILQSTKSRGICKLGVTYDRCVGKYMAQVHDGDIRKTIGHYVNEEDAFTAYKDKKISIIKKVIEEYKDILPNRVLTALSQFEIN